jgi:hypothetical protein
MLQRDVREDAEHHGVDHQVGDHRPMALKSLGNGKYWRALVMTRIRLRTA